MFPLYIQLALIPKEFLKRWRGEKAVYLSMTCLYKRMVWFHCAI